MAMDDDNGERRQAIATAIAGELERQARDGAARIDVEALAEAIDIALDPPAPASEGRQLDGEEAVAVGMRHHDAERFAGDFYDNWLMGLGPVETAFLHRWVLHLHIARARNR